MNILITNDDGVHGAGLVHLARALRGRHRLTIVAPDREQSGASHSLTLDRPLLARKVDDLGIDAPAYAVNGTPVDCARLGLGALCGGSADLLISGINNGANLGGDVAYSGTVHAALEGCACGVPSLALSLRMGWPPADIDRDEAFRLAAECSAMIVDQLPLQDLDGVMYNINFPEDVARMPRRLKVCPQGESSYGVEYKAHQDAFGRTFYWARPDPRASEYNESRKTDVYWSGRGHATLTPLRWNMTAARHMERAMALADSVVFPCGEEEAEQ